eukprot:IDg7461t1
MAGDQRSQRSGSDGADRPRAAEQLIVIRTMTLRFWAPTDSTFRLSTAVAQLVRKDGKTTEKEDSEYSGNPGLGAAFRPSSGWLEDNPQFKDYPYDYGLPIYEEYPARNPVMDSEGSLLGSSSGTTDGVDSGDEGMLPVDQDSAMAVVLPTNECQPMPVVENGDSAPATKVTKARPSRPKAKKTIRMTASRAAPSPTGKSGKVSLGVVSLYSNEIVAVAIASGALGTKSLKVRAEKAAADSSEDEDLQETVEEVLSCMEHAIPSGSTLPRKSSHPSKTVPQRTTRTPVTAAASATTEPATGASPSAANKKDYGDGVRFTSWCIFVKRCRSSPEARS